MCACRAIDIMPLVADSYGESGLCFSGDNPEQVADMIFAFNKVHDLLMKRMDSEGTVSKWDGPVFGGVFGLPMDCHEVRQVFLNGCEVTLRDKWYEGQIGHKLSSCGSFCGPSDLIDMGDGYATPDPWPSNIQDARYGVMAEDDTDAGKVIQIEGKDRYGHLVKEDIVLLPQQQVASSQSALTDLTFQYKGITNGAVVGFVTYPARKSERILRLPPNAPQASFHRKKLPLHFGNCTGVLSILGKLRFAPIVRATDLMLICDQFAIGWALQAIAAMSRRDPAAYNAFLSLAINELQKQAQNLQPAGVVTQMRITAPVRFQRRSFF